MIEVLFGESEAGAMKYATMGRRNNYDSDVICLGFMLDIGSLKENITSRYRKNLIYSMYNQNQWGKDSDMDKELMKAGDAYEKELNRLKELMREGKAIRIWYSNSPYSICGFYHLCNLAANYPCDVFAVKLPEIVRGKDTVTTYTSWGEVEAENLQSYTGISRKLTAVEKNMYGALWKELVEDNSPLRAVVNGRVVGVPESFYDFLIWKKLTKTPVKEARLIGDILCSYQLSVGDFWYASRINYFIEKGVIQIVQDSHKSYERILTLS